MLRKILIASILGTAVMLSNASGAPAFDPANRYLQAATVEACFQDFAVLIDDDGNVWHYANDELHSGQRVMLILNNSGTPDYLHDDAIEDVLYCNSTECKED
jgi:hypothetical protein